VSKAPIKIMVVFGTRPEALKLAPVIRGLLASPASFQPRVCVTAQHREMLDQVLKIFSIVPDSDLNLMEPAQTLAEFAARSLAALNHVVQSAKPDIVVVQGDTTTSFVAALAAYYNHVSVAHVEAGLRSFNKHAPFPEELNRALTTKLADFHFAPTEGARRNLMREGIPPEKIFVTGNTIVDALTEISAKLDSGELRPQLQDRLRSLPEKYVLVTAHRRENHGRNLREICSAILELSETFPELHFFYPVHLNPEVQAATGMLAGCGRIHLLPPLDYLSFIWLMRHCALILTDSGGVQEESPSLGKRVLVMREVTERPEAVESGYAVIVGPHKERIMRAAAEVLSDGVQPSFSPKNPFGDGRASERIVTILQQVLAR
jgi:UDP-N-acetylglucosamine 2-epimerase (non-hydrolysing)